MDTEQKPKRVARTWVAVLSVIFVLCIVGIAYLDRTGISEALNRADLIPKPEPFTELYFNDVTALPTTTVADAPLTFSFTINNKEGSSTAYPYSVYFIGNDGAQTIFASDTVSLSSGASTTIMIAHWLPADASGSVVVDLSSLDQTIDFLLPNHNSR
jgi:hypothetical protein